MFPLVSSLLSLFSPSPPTKLLCQGCPWATSLCPHPWDCRLGEPLRLECLVGPPLCHHRNGEMFDVLEFLGGMEQKQG
jgi:hypothetical protein